MGILVNWQEVNRWAARELDCENLNDNPDVYVSGYHNSRMGDLMQIKFANQSVYVPVEFVTDLDEIAQRIVRDGILICQSSLVDELLGNGMFEWDDVENMSSAKDESDLKYEYKDEWTRYDLAVNGPESFVEYLLSLPYSVVVPTDNSEETLAEAFPDELETWQEILEARTDIELQSVDTFTEYLENVCREDVMEDNEVFEWWAVDSWLERKLRERGEPILDNDFGTWWGRCTTGQAIFADGIMQSIARELA